MLMDKGHNWSNLMEMEKNGSWATNTGFFTFKASYEEIRDRLEDKGVYE